MIEGIGLFFQQQQQQQQKGSDSSFQSISKTFKKDPNLKNLA